MSAATVPSKSAIELFRLHMRRRVDISDADFKRCMEFFVPKKVRKHQFILQEGEVCKVLSYVTKGCLRVYSVDAKGEEHVIQFAVEDWWASDLSSFIAERPSQWYVDALEDSETLTVSKPDRERLFAAVPIMERYFRILVEANYVATHKRINDALSVSAEERYLSFLKTYPNLVQRVSQKQIASYLGITPQSLSRIRKQMAKA